MWKTGLNYEKLTTNEKARVPDMYYHVSLSLVKGRAEYALSIDMEEAEPSKNNQGVSLIRQSDWMKQFLSCCIRTGINHRLPSPNLLSQTAPIPC